MEFSVGAEAMHHIPGTWHVMTTMCVAFRGREGSLPVRRPAPLGKDSVHMVSLSVCVPCAVHPTLAKNSQRSVLATMNFSGAWYASDILDIELDTSAYLISCRFSASWSTYISLKSW